MDKEDVIYIYPPIYIYNGILFSHKNDILPFAATWMDIEIIILSEITQPEKDKYYISLHMVTNGRKKGVEG